eukprot:GHVT01000556.1.p2 GENE.GHVT01000556.1~~GHVT01000556.1.p2  ORF type:complete len:107 (+),score=4.75 GHVT01000556.1:314-634(+)
MNTSGHSYSSAGVKAKPARVPNFLTRLHQLNFGVDFFRVAAFLQPSDARCLAVALPAPASLVESLYGALALKHWKAAKLLDAVPASTQGRVSQPASDRYLNWSYRT